MSNLRVKFMLVAGFGFGSAANANHKQKIAASIQNIESISKLQQVRIELNEHTHTHIHIFSAGKWNPCAKVTAWPRRQL